MNGEILLELKINNQSFSKEDLDFFSFHEDKKLSICFSEQMLSQLKVEDSIKENEFLSIELKDSGNNIFFSKISNNTYKFFISYEPLIGFRKMITDIEYY